MEEAISRILVAGAGIAGLWQAVTLARAGHKVRLIERSQEPFADASSRLAGAMLAPYCESEAADPVIAELGEDSVELWREIYPATQLEGSLVVATPRDLAELPRFARMTANHQAVDGNRIAELEPDLAGRFSKGLFYPTEGHVEPPAALDALLKIALTHGVEFETGVAWDGERPQNDDFAVDCRGMGARGALSNLRGVRGEMAVIETAEVSFSRPLRLLHPRMPFYIVPWSGNRFMLGATLMESEKHDGVTLRSALDLLGMAYTLHPAFGEARIVSFAAGLRPSLPDNIPRVIVRDRHILVNGFYRHGFLLAPVLARLAKDYIEGKEIRRDVLIEDHGEWRAANDRSRNA
ncbi:MAG: FAD-dependent oxidoreductase [Hyphomicrobiales bacterium]|nr:FAD-dependent oxidoreductase [Hyphomicrobiales bacterium]